MPYNYIGNFPDQQLKNTGVFSPGDINNLQSFGEWGGSLQLIERKEVTGVSAADFLAIQEDRYDVHLLQINNYQTSVNSSSFAGVRFYESGVLESSGVYEIAYQRGDSNGAFGVLQSTANAQLNFTRNFGSGDANHSGNGYMYFYNLGNSSKYSFQTLHSSYLDQSSNAEFTMGGGVLPQASKVDGIRIFEGSGTGTFSATMQLFGVKEL